MNSDYHQHDSRAQELAEHTLSKSVSNDESLSIRQKMALLRSGLKSDAAELKQEAKQAAHLSFYVKKFPLACAGAAFVLGYALIPPKREVVQASDSQLEKLAKQGKLDLNSDNAKQGSVVNRAALAVGAMVARAAMSYVGQQFGALLAPDYEKQQSAPQDRSRRN